MHANKLKHILGQPGTVFYFKKDLNKEPVPYMTVKDCNKIINLTSGCDACGNVYDDNPLYEEPVILLKISFHTKD